MRLQLIEELILAIYENRVLVLPLGFEPRIFSPRFWVMLCQVELQPHDVCR